MKVVRKEESRVYMDGPEVCREYVVTPKITFGSSTLHPAAKAAMDASMKILNSLNRIFISVCKSFYAPCSIVMEPTSVPLPSIRTTL